MNQSEEAVLVASSILTFLSIASEQELAAVEAQPSLLRLLEKLNASFNNIPDKPIAGPALPPLLLSQAHSAFLAAVRLSLGGQVHVAYMALRGCIESGLV